MRVRLRRSVERLRDATGGQRRSHECCDAIFGKPGKQGFELARNISFFSCSWLNIGDVTEATPEFEHYSNDRIRRKLSNSSVGI